MRERPLIAPLECLLCCPRARRLGRAFVRAHPEPLAVSLRVRSAMPSAPDDAERGPSPLGAATPVDARLVSDESNLKKPSRSFIVYNKPSGVGGASLRGSGDPDCRRQRTSSVRGGCGRRRARVTPHDRHTERYNSKVPAGGTSNVVTPKKKKSGNRF